MFGFVRFSLACFVVITHVAGILPHAGGFAVYAFYIFSGYLMALVMNRRYGYDIKGIFRFYLNRALRIYPQYWLTCLITLSVLLFGFSGFALQFHPAMRLPETIYDYIANIFILGLFPGGEVIMPRLVPPAWALHVELVFYILIGLFLGRSLKIAVIWFLISAIYHIFAVKYLWPRYSPLYAASLAFSLGCLIYHLRDHLRIILPYNKKVTLGLTVSYLCYVPIAGWLPITTSVYPFYLNILLFSILLYQLSLVPKGQSKIEKWDEWFGNLSYPIYLNHWVISMVISYYLGIALSVELLYAAPAIILISWLFVKLVEMPIEVIRQRIAAYSQTHKISL